jgi:putative sterol carrier protein
MSTTTSTTAPSEFFGELARRGHEPLLRKATGVIRFDIVDGDRTEPWTVSIDHGDLEVSQRNIGCDCTLRMSRALFERVARGEANQTTAVLRGEIELEGHWRLLVLSQRLFRAKAVHR